MAVQSCVKEANANYDRIDNSVNGIFNGEIDTTLQALKKEAAQGCFTKENVKQAYYSLYFDPTTGVVDKEVESRREQYWKEQKNNVQFVERKGTSAQIQSAQAEFFKKFKKIHPEGISAISQKSIPLEMKVNQCKTVNNIIPKLPPIRDQGHAGWCYFFSSADLLSFASGKNISASYLGNLMGPTGDGGNSEALNQVVKKFGLCLEKTMPSNGMEKDYFKDLDDLSKAVIASKKSKVRTGCVTNVDDNLLGRFPLSSVSDIIKISMAAVNKDGQIIDLHIPEVINGSLSINASASIGQYLSLNECKDDRKQLEKFSQNIQLATLDSGKSSSERFNKIDQELSAGKPVNIAYDIGAMTLHQSSEKSDHWSSVVGRRYKDGECQYQVRNSWGPSVCTKMVSDKDACEPPGYYWVSATDLYRTITDVQYLQ